MLLKKNVNGGVVLPLSRGIFIEEIFIDMSVVLVLC